MKKILAEIAIITMVSIAVALIYNELNPNNIPVFPKNKEELRVSDSLLFQNIAENNKNTVPQNFGEISQDTAKKINTFDSVKTEKKSDSSIKNMIDTAKIKNEKIDANTILANTKKSKHSDYQNVSHSQMLKIVNNYEKFLIIDARRPEQYAAAHIPHAINIFPNDDEQAVVDKILALPSDKTIIIYCDGGNCDLSHHIAGLLENFGFKRFYIYESGWAEWSNNPASKNISQ